LVDDCRRDLHGDLVRRVAPDHRTADVPELSEAASLLVTSGVFALAILGMLWANGPWSTRFHSVDPVAKLLAIPFLFYHFGRSQRGHWVFIAFLLSCVLLMLASWGVLFAPEWRMTYAQIAGVPIKNYIDQSQEFALCIFALVYLISALFSQRRFMSVAICAVLVFGFCANLMFVVVARTALVYTPAIGMCSSTFLPPGKVLLTLSAIRYQRQEHIFSSSL
jgi:hypothetical protein